MDILGLIPARGGSKGIPHKNIVPLLDRPLLAYTCEAALASGQLSRVIMSTDDLRIAEVAREHDVEAPFMRPAELAQDDTLALPVVQHAVRWLEENEGYSPGAVMILQPTSPLRRAEHITGAIEVMDRTGADTVVSVVEVPHQYGPASLMSFDAHGRLVPYESGTMVLSRQDKPVLYARNGPAVLLVKKTTLMDQEMLYGANTQPYLMDEIDSFDVDTINDLVIIEALMTQRRG
jgi:CMP-N-acetylneuraminic acid synthetase